MSRSKSAVRANRARKIISRVAFTEALEQRLHLYGGVDKLINNNNGATGTGFFTQSETTLLAYDNNVIAGFNDSGSNAAGAGPGDGGGGAGSAGFTGWSRSTDGGNTFTDGGTLPENTGGHAGDPVLARNNVTGRVYMATLGFTVSTIRIFRSDDNGATWAGATTGTPGGSSEDKQWLTVDNFAGAGQGNVYLISRRFAGTQGTYFYRSLDHGGTFTTGLQLWNGTVQGAYIAVGTDHSIYAFSLVNNNTLQMRKSTDFGVTFSVATTIASGLGGGTNGDLALTGMRNGLGTFSGFRSNGFPSVAINPISGHIYVTYANNPAGGDKADIQMVMSTNGGTSFSAPVRVNDDVGTLDQWQSSVSVTPDGTRLGVFYYSREGDAANNLFRFRGRLATISGATVTFSASENISDVDSRPEFGRDTLVNTVYMGDYDQSAATNDAFHVVWSDSRSALPGGGVRMDPNVYYDKIPLAVSVNSSQFAFETAPHQIKFTFNTNVSANLDTSDLVLQNLTTLATIPTADLSLSYDLGTNTATFTYIGPGTDAIAGVLADGNYEATILASGVAGLPADHVFNFFFLQGDANRDGQVNLTDYNILTANYNQSPRTFSQADFSYDGQVNLADYNILTGQYGEVLGSGGRGSSLFGGTIDSDEKDEGDALKELLS